MEILRTSTAEPTASGIYWTYTKDVSSYLSLFRRHQKIIFDLGNLINDKYTGPFNVTLTALFFASGAPPDVADIIMPISAKRSKSNQPSTFSLPDDRAISQMKLPMNVRRAVVTLLATGQGEEEFWYGNEATSRFSPFREVQLLINGSLAGVVSPYPVIFTGGFSPLLWRPIVGMDAFDLREGEIDITPWLPLICDPFEPGTEFEIRVVGIEKNNKTASWQLSESVGSYWVVTGKVFIWLNGPDDRTPLGVMNREIPPPDIQLDYRAYPMTTFYEIRVLRALSITTLTSSTAEEQFLSWSQTIAFSIGGWVSDGSNSQYIVMNTQGSDTSSGGYASNYRYSGAFTLKAKPDKMDDGLFIEGQVSRGMSQQSHGPSVLPSSLGLSTLDAPIREARSSRSDVSLNTTQRGKFRTHVSNDGNMTFASADNDQELAFLAVDIYPDDPINASENSPLVQVESYHRHVYAQNGVLLQDDEELDDVLLPSRISSLSKSELYREHERKYEYGGMTARFPSAFNIASILAAQTDQKEGKTQGFM